MGSSRGTIKQSMEEGAEGEQSVASEGQTGEFTWAAKGDAYFPAAPLLLLNISTWQPVLHPRTTLRVPVGFHLISKDGENIQPTGEETREADGGTWIGQGSSWLHCHPETVDAMKGGSNWRRGWRQEGQGAVSSNTPAMWWGQSHSHAQRKPLCATTGSESPFLTCTPDTWVTSASQPLGSQTQALNSVGHREMAMPEHLSWNPGKSSGHVSRTLWPLFSLLPSVSLFCFLKVLLHQNLRLCDFWGPECSPWAYHSGLMWVESHRK